MESQLIYYIPQNNWIGMLSILGVVYPPPLLHTDTHTHTFQLMANTIHKSSVNESC